MDTQNRAAFLGVSLVIYDLDGTLVDAFADIAMAMNVALTRRGHMALAEGEIREFVGDGAMRLAERCLKCVGELAAVAGGGAVVEKLEMDMNEVRAVADDFTKYYAAHPADAAVVYPGVLETLRMLRGRGVHQALLTNKPESVAGPLCERLGIAALLDGLWGARDGGPLKPAAEAALRVAGHFGLMPGQCAMVGDGPPDHAVARAAGMPMIGVTYGMMSKAAVKAAAPAAMVDAFAEIEGLIGPEAEA